MLGWLLWLLLILGAAIAAWLLMWVALIAVVVVGSVGSLDRCPSCGVDLEVSDHDRWLDESFDPKYRSRARAYCRRCGWRSPG